MNTNSTITWSANPARIEQVAKRTFNLWTVALALLLSAHAGSPHVHNGVAAAGEAGGWGTTRG